MFGLTGSGGNHGEDVKEAFFYLDSTPTHSYIRMNYKYPHAEFPYAALIEENRKRSRTEPEFELWDTGIFADDRYFDIDIKYAKATRRICCVESLCATWAPTTRRSVCCQPFGFETPRAGNAMT